MTKRVASIPLMLPLQALLLVAGIAAAAAGSGNDAGVIRLPSDEPAPSCNGGQTIQGGIAVVRGTKEGNGGKRPWKCCDKPVPGPMTEGKEVWYCMDKVKKCTCDSCFELQGSQRYYYCLDGYHGSKPGPSCTRA